jgi:hypothetical protein
LRESARLKREEMEEDRQQVYERWDTAVKASDGDGSGDAKVLVDVEAPSVEAQSVQAAKERLENAKSEAAALLKASQDDGASKKKAGPTVEERLRAAKSEAESLLKAGALCNLNPVDP